MCQINMLVGINLEISFIYIFINNMWKMHVSGIFFQIDKHATMFIGHTRLIDEVEFVNASATATEAHAADIDATAVTDEINTNNPIKPGPINVRILSCRSRNVGIDINFSLMMSGSSCCFIKYSSLPL